jgi:hypothetical protein
VARALGHERRLEVGVRRLASVVDALGELERALGVLAGSLEVALAAMDPRAPVVDVGAETVARAPPTTSSRLKPALQRRTTFSSDSSPVGPNPLMPLAT